MKSEHPVIYLHKIPVKCCSKIFKIFIHSYSIAVSCYLNLDYQVTSSDKSYQVPSTTCRGTITILSGIPSMATITVSTDVKLPNPRIGGEVLPTIKLTYFNLRARAEPARLLLAYAGVEYEDERLPPPWEDIEKWGARKKDYPYGCLPMLYWGEEELGQSLAIARFIAQKVGLAGRDSLESAQVDEIVLALQDVFNAGYAVVFEKDAERKAELASKHKNQTIPQLLKNIEARLASRGGLYLVGNRVTWADMQTFYFCSELSDQEVLSQVPRLKSLVDRVGNIPNIKTWMEIRPSNPF